MNIKNLKKIIKIEQIIYKKNFKKKQQEKHSKLKYLLINFFFILKIKHFYSLLLLQHQVIHYHSNFLNYHWIIV